MKASGSSLVVSELVSELPWNSDTLPVVVTHPYGQFSPITRAEFSVTELSLEIEADPDSETFRDLLNEVTELLDDLSPKGSKLTAALRTRITELANKIEEAL